MSNLLSCSDFSNNYQMSGLDYEILFFLLLPHFKQFVQNFGSHS